MTIIPDFYEKFKVISFHKCGLKIKSKYGILEIYF